MDYAEEDNAPVVVRGCRAFASKFHKVIAHENGGNIAFSPFSMHLMLCYLFHGSDGMSAKEIVAALCLFYVNGLHEQYNTIINQLHGIQKRPQYNCGVDIPEEDKNAVTLASGIFVQQGVELEKTFKQKGSAFYFFNAEKVDFKDKNRSAESINSWISEKTRNKINNVLSPGDISDLTKVMLVSTMYLKVKWQFPFHEGCTQHMEFHITENLKKQVPMMHQMNYFRCGDIPSMKSRFVLLPYEHGDLDMVLILPDKAEGFQFMEDNFDWITIQKAPCSKYITDLHMPRFKIEATLDLKSIRHKMQLGSIFEGRGDFEKICSAPMEPPLKVDGMVQKVFLDVNEAGTEAGVCSAMRGLGGGSGRPPGLNFFVVNRPFMAVIRHVHTNIPLFVANVRDIGEKPTEVKTEADKAPIARRHSDRLQAKKQRESKKEKQLKENKRPKK